MDISGKTTYVIEWKKTSESLGTVQVKNANGMDSKIDFLSPSIYKESALEYMKFVKKEFLTDGWRLLAIQPTLVDCDDKSEFGEDYFPRYYIERIPDKVKLTGGAKRSNLEIVTE